MFIKLLSLFLLVTYLTGCSVANTVRMMYANDDLTPSWSNDKQEQVFEAVYIGDKPYIYATINNEKLLFLIDTGASFSMLFDTSKGKALATNRGYDIAISGWGEGESTAAYQTSISHFELGSISFKDVKLAYIPLSKTNYFISEKEAIFDGVLGHDLLRHFSWTFDKRNREITASSSVKHFSADDNVVPFETTFKKISIPVKIAFNNNHNYQRDIIIDTGSRHYLKLNSQFIKNKKISFPASVGAADFGMSGMVEHKRVSVDDLQIGSVNLKHIKTNIIPGDDEDDWWVIGSALMNQFITVIDYHSSSFALMPYKNGQFTSRYNLAGVELRKLQNGHFIIRYIFPGFKSDSQDLSVGDEIVSINNIDAAKMAESDWLSLAANEGEITLCVYQKSCSSFMLSHIKGYSTPAG